jgi:hypothetical protein
MKQNGSFEVCSLIIVCSTNAMFRQFVSFYRNGDTCTNASLAQGLVLPRSVCHALSTTASG